MSFHPDFTPPEDAKLYEHHSTISWVQDGAFCIHAKPGIEHTLEEAKLQTKLSQELFAGKRSTVVLDVRQAPPLGIEARNYYKSPVIRENFHTICVIVDSPISRVIGNFYLGVFNKKLRTKLFKSGPQALEWVRDQKMSHAS